MAGSLVPMPRFYGLDAGLSLPAARLYFYESGTTTPKNTYNDPDLAVPHANANPVVADASGLFGAIYLLPDAYKVVLKTSADVTLWTADPVQGRSEQATAHAFSVRRTSAQTIATGVNTQISFNVEDLDTDAQFDATTDFRFEPTEEGSVWEFNLQVTVQSMTGTVQIVILSSQNSGTILAQDSRTLVAEEAIISCSGVNTTPFTVGDYVHAYVVHTHGSDRTVTGRFYGKQIGLV